MSFSDFSRAGEREAAQRRTFDALDVHERARTPMRDPQQPVGYGGEEDVAPLVSPGIARGTTVLVEPVVFESVEHLRPAAVQAAEAQAQQEPPPPDPAVVAQQLVDEARVTARTMLAQARDVIAAERAQAVQQGYDEGFARGVAEADVETAGLIATCEQIGVQVMAERERVLEENEPDVVELAIAIARRVVNASIEIDEQLVVEACRGAMRKAFQRDAMQVLAHPEDLALLRAAGPELARELGGVQHLDFVEERRLDRGSVVVRTPAGEIDATVAGKADKIEQSLREGVEQRRAERRAA